MTDRILTLTKIALTIIGAVATVVSCLLAFIVLVNPIAAQRVIVEIYNPTTPTPQVILITQTVPTISPLSTYTPYPTYTPPTILQPTKTSTLVPTLAPPTDMPFGFSDNFDNGPSSIWEIANGNWFSARGKALPLESSGGIVLAGDISWTDYIVEVDISGGDGDFTKGFDAGVLLHAQDAENYVEFFIDCAGSYMYADYSVWRVAKENQITEVPGTHIQGGSDRFCNPHRYRFEVKGKKYTVFADNELVSSFALGVYPSGKVGLWSASRPQGNNAVGAFDNFTVRK